MISISDSKNSEAVTREEMYILHDLYREFNMSVRRMYGYYLLANGLYIYYAGSWIKNSQLPFALKCLSIGGGIYMINGFKNIV